VKYPCRILVCATVAYLNYLLPPAAIAEGDNDWTGLTSPTCEVQGLMVAPPKGWMNAPVDTAGDETFAGCQMMLMEQGVYLGILRFFSHDLSKPRKNMPDKWQEYVLGLEPLLMSNMGFEIGEPLWRRESVPVRGAGFSSAEAMGLSVHIEGAPAPWEVHVLLFKNETYHYLMSMLTPAKSAQDGGQLYQENTDAMGLVMRTLQPKPQLAN
jgi:hypothetical protein